MTELLMLAALILPPCNASVYVPHVGDCCIFEDTRWGDVLSIVVREPTAAEFFTEAADQEWCGLGPVDSAYQLRPLQ